MTHENKPIPDIFEMLTARFGPTLRFQAPRRRPEGGPDYELRRLQYQDQKVRKSFEQSMQEPRLRKKH